MVHQGDSKVSPRRLTDRPNPDNTQQVLLCCQPLVCAASNLAATNFERGMSFHALGMLPVDADANGNTTIKLKPGGTLTPERLALFRAAALIVIDEGPSLNKCVIEALLYCLAEHSCQVRLLIVGDMQQIPPIYGNSREETVEASIVASADFHQWVQLWLTKQYRAASDPEWGEQNRRLGDGTADMLLDHEFNDAARGGHAAGHQPLLARAGGGGAPEPHHPATASPAGRPSLPLLALPAARKPPASTPPLTLTRRSSGCGGARPTAGSTCTPASRRCCARRT